MVPIMSRIWELNPNIPNIWFPDIFSVEIEPCVHLDVRICGSLITCEHCKSFEFFFQVCAKQKVAKLYSFVDEKLK